MFDFLREGGFAMLPILLVGTIGLTTALRRISLEDPTSLHLALATFMLGVGATGLCFYVTFARWNRGDFGSDVARVGFMECLTPLIAGSALASLIVLVDLTSRALLRRVALRPTPRA